MFGYKLVKKERTAKSMQEAEKIESDDNLKRLYEIKKTRLSSPQRFLVTGGAGFIGSHIVEELNKQGYSQIDIVDDFSDARKLLNLKGLEYDKIYDISEGYESYSEKKTDSDSFYSKNSLVNRVREGTIIFHEGAISSTTETDGNKLFAHNICPTDSIIQHAIDSYCVISLASSASVYGDTGKFSVDPESENPINAYAMTKYMIDNRIRATDGQGKFKIQSWRYFNVYGEREGHKDGMRSMVSKFLDKSNGKVKIFEGSDTVDRDFIYVKDVAKIKIRAALRLRRLLDLDFISVGDEKEIIKLSGIFNLGTGKSTNVQKIADVCKSYGSSFKVIPFPKNLKGKYQFYTEADISGSPFHKEYRFKTVSEYIEECSAKDITMD